MNRRTVLVIDDDEALCRLIRRGLEPLGYEVAELAARLDQLGKTS